MRPLPLIAALLVAALPAGRGASEGWSLTGTFAQSVTGLQRVNETGDRENSAVRSTTDIGVRARNQISTTSVDLRAGLRLLGRSDPADDADAFETPLPSFDGVVAHRRDDSSLQFSASVDPEFVSRRSFTQLLLEDPDDDDDDDDLLIQRVAIEEDPLEIDLQARFNGRFSLDTRNSIGANALVARREYDETSENFQPTTRFRAGLNWSHAFSSRTNLGLNGSARYFTSDDSDRDDTIALTMTGDVSRRHTERHRTRLRAGVTATDVDDDLNLSFTGGARLNYSLASANYGLSLDQDIRQDDDGDIDNVLRLRATATYRLTSTASLQLASNASAATDLTSGLSEDPTLRIGVSAAYSKTLSERWRLRIGAGLQGIREDDEDDFRGDAQLFLRISRAFDILP